MTIVEALKISRKIKLIDKETKLSLEGVEWNPHLLTLSVADILSDSWEPIIEKKTKTVWQWRCSDSSGDWEVDSRLMTESEAGERFCLKFKYQKHAGPFEVSVND